MKLLKSHIGAILLYEIWESIGTIHFSSDADPNAYYEFTAVPSANSEYIQILGLNDTPIIHNRGTEFTLPMSGDVCQILITNVTVNDDGIRFDIADYIDLETDEY